MRRSDPLVAQLTERGRDFTGAQRRELLALIGGLVAPVIPRYRALSERGQCELSVTPYAHPIVPLLFDFNSARDAVPAMPLPQHAALSRRRGARGVARRGVDPRLHARLRRRPAGCWPSEGAMSRARSSCSSAQGFRWAASGRAVLRDSLP